MKLFRKIRKALLTFCACAAALCGVIALTPAFQFDKATAEGTIASNVYKTDGASVRVFQTTKDEQGKDSYGETDKKGIRFHVEMGAGYVYGGKEIVNTTAEKYNRGSYKLTDGFKTYTLVLPTRLLSGDLMVDTEKVMKIDTTEYWFSDKDGNYESVAYVYNIPEKWYTDNFSYRGVICTVAEDGTETVVSQTEVTERNLAWVAKQAYNDTIIEDNHYWGTAEKDDAAAPLIKQFIPTYSITYKVNGVETREEVLWGDAPQNAPTEGVKGAWYDTNNSEEVKVGKEIPMNWAENRTLVLESTASEEFILSGVASKTDFEVAGNTYSGAKVFATLHREAFSDKTQMDIHAVNVEHMRSGELVSNSSFKLDGVWTLEEQNTLGEWQMLLFFAFDSSSMENGDELIIKGDSIFYANNVMYKLTEDYTIDYTKVEDVEDYGMYLGDLYNSDVFKITNCSEDSSGNEGKPDEFTVRVEFYEDVMINGEFTFEFGPDSDTTKYPYPVYIQCGEDNTKLIPVAGGRYYWNEGEHKILELIGAGEYANKVFGWHNGDKLFGAPGTIVKQNGGYYIFKDEMYAYFLAKNGEVDQWGYALGNWLVGDELEQYTTSEFAAEGSVTETTDYGAPADEIRINTTNHWFGQAKVNILTTEKMSDSAPYAVYCTSKDGTVTEIDKVRYHGQEKPANEGGNYQILGLCGEGKFAVGDVVTIAEGTRFWLGTEYYTVKEEITYYYNGNFWVQNYDESTMGTLSSASFGDRAHNQGATELRMYFTAPVAGYTTTDGGAFDELRIGTGSITFNGMPFEYVRYQRWDANSTWLSFGGYSGSVAFGDKVVIEAGTTIWDANKVAYKFTEKVEWIYAANPDDTNRTWSRVRGGVTVSATADNATVSGAGTFAVGETYTLNVAPTGDYLISAVIVNNKELPLNASNTYMFTVEQSNTIKVQTVVGHKVYFTIPEGARVNGGAIANGGFGAVADGGSYTFSVEADEGYELLRVDGATNNDDGTYTVNNVTADTTVKVSVEKLYKVTYSGENASITANVDNGTWVDNGTAVTFTIVVNSGYTLLDVSNATKVNATTYAATVNAADLNVVATAKKADEFVDITDRIQIEDRAWGAHANEVYVGVLDTGVTYVGEDGKENHYLNTSVNDTWYVGNNAIIEQNNGVDIMEYIYVNGAPARELITTNANGVKAKNPCACWLSNPAAYPVYVETTNGSGLMIRLATAAFGTEFTITIKAGFRITDANGDLVAVTKDIDFNYNNATITKEVITSQYAVNLGNVTGASVTANGNTVSNGDKLAEGTEITIAPNTGYNVNSVTVNGEALTASNGVYTFTLLKDVTIDASTTLKKYTATVSATGATVSGVSNNQEIMHGQTYNFTVSVNSGYQLTSVTINGVEQGTSGSYSFTASGATSIVVTAEMTEEAKKEAIVAAITTAPSTYLTNMEMNVDANGNITITSTNTATVGFKAEFFDLLKQYGYTSVSFTIATTTTSSTSIGGGTRVQSGGQAVSGSQTILATTTYTAQVKNNFMSSYKDDNSASWTLSNVTFS